MNNFVGLIIHNRVFFRKIFIRNGFRDVVVQERYSLFPNRMSSAVSFHIKNWSDNYIATTIKMNAGRFVNNQASEVQYKRYLLSLVCNEVKIVAKVCYSVEPFATHLGKIVGKKPQVLSRSRGGGMVDTRALRARDFTKSCEFDSRPRHMNIPFILHGKNPKLLLLSGMHGDEFEVISCVKNYLETNKDALPEFLFIPEVSPTAVSVQQRRNAFGHDVNRQFFDPPTDSEVRSTMEILSPYHFDIALNFHEDPDLAQTFYLYDSGEIPPDKLLVLRSAVIEAGAGLHTGTDDPLDADLGLHVEKGYISTPYASLPQDAGFSWLWFAKHGITKRDIDIEIPGKAPIVLKQSLVDILLPFFLTPAFGF